MFRRCALALGALSMFTLAACESDEADVTGPPGSGALARYVAVGTSLSAGVQSQGLLYSTQARAWPALLADQSFAPFEYPAIRGPGCAPPMIAPLQFGHLLSGVPIATGDASCAALFPGITLPTNNVAVPGATTSAALSATPASRTGFSAMLYARILPANESQVSAMMDLDPTFVSVELGSNEVLTAATSGQVIPNATYTPPAVWEPVYTEVIDSVEATGARALLVTVPLVSRIPSMRAGAELWNARQQFLAFNIVVQGDCDGSTNLIFTPGLVLTKVAEAQAAAAQGQQAQLSCANGPVGPTPDFVLSPTEVQTLEAVVGDMNDHIASEAAANGYALLDANEVLQQFIDERPAFSLVTMLTCSFPHGQYMSLDGVHPNGYGYQLVANAAAEALNEHYGFALPTVALPAIPQC